MGIFDKLTGHKEIELTSQAGLLLAAITMVAIDGDVDDDELAIIRRLDGSGTTTDWESAVKVFKTKSTKECIALASGAMNSEQRLVAIANLIDIAMADGGLAGSEKQLLEDYVEAFSVDTDAVGAMVDVISIKNNKAIFDK